MRCLKKNKVKMYYALFKEKAPILDSNNLSTGQMEIIYDEPVEFKANVSRAIGNAETQDFGINVDYTHTMVVENVNCPINESTILWIDRDITKPHNFEVKGKSKSINSKTYAIKEVSISEN